MWIKTIGSVLVGVAGVALLWAGLAGLGSEPASARAPARVLGALAALTGLVAGAWLCWHAAARWVRPPESAGRVVNYLCGALVAALAMTAALVSIYSYLA